jgi:hypothetical protein
MADEKKTIKPTSLILDDLELKPYQYTEHADYDNNITIAARVVLSEEQYNALGKLPIFIKVTRTGIDEEPREMELAELAWSKNGNEVKEEIRLFDKEKTPELPFLVWQRNLSRLAAEHSLILDELLAALTSNNIIGKENIREIRSSITDERVWEKQRELNRVKVDLGEFKSIEDED